MFPGFRQAVIAMNDHQSDRDFTVSARPVFEAAWRGRFNIPSRNLNINISAHASDKACFKALEVASVMPESLCLEMIPRIDVWPASFESSPPTGHSVALFFFSEGRDEEILDSLLTDAIYADFALKGMVGNAKILIFTSLQLPEKFRRFQGKLFFWGVFMGEAVSSYQSDDAAVHIQTSGMRTSLASSSGNDRSFDGKGNQVSICKQSPLTHVTKADRRGRRLDGAWEHAKPLDELRQKAECRYCGFISAHGGISRLKAHLGGGHPKIRLPGCQKVSPQVKQVMADWFHEWVKNTKSLWTKEIRGHIPQVDNRVVMLDVPRTDAKPSDVTDQTTDCNYFGTVSPHKLHLGGGGPKMPIEAWPVTKVVMSERLKKSTASMIERTESLTSSKVKKSKGADVESDRRGRPLDHAWEHAKPLDEARQKTQCNYCGFVSQYGGISRLKAHLGGGCLQIQLQGCPLVPLELKRVMEQWYNEWAKTSTAAWTRKAGTPVQPSKKARELDAIWEHAIPLDETRQATKCKYCGFISKHGGIARLKAHLVGGDPATQLQGCPNASLDIKSSMSKETKKSRKKLKGTAMETTGGVLQDGDRTANEVQWFEKRHHILQETLEEIRNTSMKETFQKMLEEKNAKVRKMQTEIQSLKSQLDTMM